MRAREIPSFAVVPWIFKSVRASTRARIPPLQHGLPHFWNKGIPVGYTLPHFTTEPALDSWKPLAFSEQYAHARPLTAPHDDVAHFQGHATIQGFLHHGGMQKKMIRLRRNKPDRKGRPGSWKMRLTWVKDPRLVGKLYEVGLGTRDVREAFSMARGVQALVRALEGETPLILLSESELPTHREE